MKTDFDEARGAEGMDPLDSARFSIPFNFDEVEAVKTHLQVTEYDRLGAALFTLFEWVVFGGEGQRRLTPRDPRNIGVRFAALCWVMRPDLFEGTPALAELARQLQINKVIISRHSAEAHRRFGIRNRAQSHASNFKPNQPETDDASQDEFDSNEE